MGERKGAMGLTYDLSGIPEEMACLHGWLYWVGNKVPRTLKKDPVTGKCNHTYPFGETILAGGGSLAPVSA